MPANLNLDQLRGALRRHPAASVALALPGGRRIPAQFHVTEAGTVTKDFMDCGGARRRRVTAQLQAWIGRDTAHRLSAAKLGGILEASAAVLPDGDAAVEVEYEDEVVSQYPLAAAEPDGGELVLQLGLRHTDCLAREACGREEAGAAAPAGCGCGPGCG